VSVPDLGTILSVWAHPDDETYLAGGLSATLTDEGQRVVCVTATRGEAGESSLPTDGGHHLAAIRTAELDEALALLGVEEHHWLDYPDGGCADVPTEEAVGRLTEIIGDVQPDTVLTFGPDGATWHPDHIAVSRWATAAVAGTKAQVHYNSTTPEWYEFMSEFIDPSEVMMDDREPPIHPVSELSIYVQLDGELLDMKYDAMLCQLSQVKPLVDALGADNYRRMLAEEAFRPASAEHPDRWS